MNPEHNRIRSRGSMGKPPARGLPCAGVVVVLCTGAHLAAATLSDNFADRETVTDRNGQIDGSNVAATRELNEPRHGGKPGGRSVWVSWVAPEDGVATFSTDGSNFDTLLSAYYFEQPADTTLDKLKEAARNDDASDATRTSLIQFGARAGVTYHVAMDGFLDAGGDIRLRWDFIAAKAPPPIIVSVPNDQAARQGDPVTLRVWLQDVSPELKFNWRLNGEDAGSETEELVIPSLQPTNVGLYTLRITIDNVRFETAPVELQINSEGQTNALARDKLFDALESPLTPDDDDGDDRRRALASVRRAALAAIGVTRGYNGTQVFNTTFATVDPAEPAHCGLAADATYWFAYQPPADGTLVVDTLGSGFDTFAAAYTYTPPLTSYADLVPIRCDDNGAGGNAARLEFATPKGRPFFVVVAGVNGARGIVHLNYTLDTNRPPLAPVLAPVPPRHIAAVGTPVVLAADAAGSPPLRFAWYRDGMPLNGETNATLEFPKVDYTDEGDYAVVILNHLGQASNAPVHLRVVLPPQLELSRVDNVGLLAFRSRAGQNYVLEATAAFPATNWLALGDALVGDGQPLVFTNSFADPASVFYRVRVE